MRPRWELGILFAAALALRLVYVAEIRNTVTFESPVVDAMVYDRTAREVQDEGLAALELPFYQPPLYPLFLAGLYRLTDGSYLAPRVAQALLGSLTALLVFVLAAGAGGVGGAGPARRAGWIAGGLMALYGAAIYFDGELLPPSLLLALLAAALALLLRADARPHPLPPLLGAGLLLGLAAAARPSLLLVGGVAALWWWRGARGEGGPRHRSTALLVLALALPVLPFTVANLAGSGDAVLVSTNGGINLYLGNGTNPDSLAAIQPGHHWEKLQVEPLRAGVNTPADESTYWTKRALREAAADPVGWLAADARKLLRLLDARETPRNTDYEDFRRDSRLLSLPLPAFGLVAPLAFLGLVLGLGANRANRRRRWLLAGVLVAVTIENVLFFVAGRYRLEAVPALCALAGIGANSLIARRGRMPAAAWAGLVAVVAVVWIDFLGERAIDEPRARIHRAVAAQRAGLNASSERLLREAARLDPDDIDANRLLGEAAARNGDWAGALEHFQRAVDGAGDYEKALLGVARSLEQLGRGDEAEPYYRRAVEADPFDPDARMGLGVFLAVRKRWDEARDQLTIGLKIAPDHEGLRTNLRNLTRAEGGS